MTDESSPEEYPPESSSAQSPGADVSDNVERKRLEAQIAKQEKVKEDLEKQIKEKNLEIKRLEEETDRLQKEVLQNIASPGVAKLELERQNWKKLCDGLISEKKDLRKRLEEAEDEIEELRKKLTQARREGNQRTEELLGELNQTKRELDNTKRRLTQAELDRDEQTQIVVNWQNILEGRSAIEQSERPSAAIASQGTSPQETTTHRRSGSRSTCKTNQSSNHEGATVRSYQNFLGETVKVQYTVVRKK
jgi:chromosome segregation ATPase